MSPRWIVLTGALAAATAAALWWWLVACDRRCAAADRDAQDLFERGELLPALQLIDKVDARCRCARFTSGDAPPQYALGKACLERLRREGKSVEVQNFLSRARGPILKELADRLGKDDPRH